MGGSTLVRSPWNRSEEDENQAAVGETTMIREVQKSSFVICVKNDECEDLELRKIYRVLDDKPAAKEGYLRIVDESGEDYLYPSSYFVPIRLPQKAQAAMISTC
jgi:hypothetical protein